MGRSDTTSLCTSLWRNKTRPYTGYHETDAYPRISIEPVLIYYNGLTGLAGTADTATVAFSTS